MEMAGGQLGQESKDQDGTAEKGESWPETVFRKKVSSRNEKIDRKFHTGE